MIEITAAASKDYKTIQDIAYQTWPLTYSSILSKDQLDFMLDVFYSLDKLRDTVENRGHHFLLAMEGDNCLGFISFENNFNHENKTKIHKIYILPETQGKGIGKKLIAKVEEGASRLSEKAVVLNVNRFNKAIHFYKKLGFEIVAEEDIEIGNGYLMQDFVLEKPLLKNT